MVGIEACKPSEFVLDDVLFPQQDYQTFMSRKAQKRQDLVVSLNDYHKQELEKIEKEREELLEDYKEKRTGALTYTM